MTQDELHDRIVMRARELAIADGNGWCTMFTLNDEIEEVEVAEECFRRYLDQAEREADPSGEQDH